MCDSLPSNSNHNGQVSEHQTNSENEVQDDNREIKGSGDAKHEKYRRHGKPSHRGACLQHSKSTDGAGERKVKERKRVTPRRAYSDITGRKESGASSLKNREGSSHRGHRESRPRPSRTMSGQQRRERTPCGEARTLERARKRSRASHPPDQNLSEHAAIRLVVTKKMASQPKMICRSYQSMGESPVTLYLAVPRNTRRQA